MSDLRFGFPRAGPDDQLVLSVSGQQKDQGGTGANQEHLAKCQNPNLKADSFFFSFAIKC